MQATEYIEKINEQLEELKKATKKTEDYGNKRYTEEKSTYNFKLPEAN